MLINLERMPNLSDSYIWGDYIELLCIVSQDGLVSKFDILDRLNDNADIDIAETKTDDTQPDDLADDKQERQAADWFRQLEYRQGAFDKFGGYPFEVSPDRDTLFLRTPLTPQHKLYIYLTNRLKFAVCVKTLST